MFKALSNPHRLAIFLQLAKCCSRQSCSHEDMCCCVGDLGKNLSVVPSTVSHHVKELVNAGLIRCERRGQNIDCWVDPKILKDMSQFFNCATR